MKLNQQKVEETVLAVLWLTLHNEVEAWKTNLADGVYSLTEL